jgi:ribosome-binding factor A
MTTMARRGSDRRSHSSSGGHRYPRVFRVNELLREVLAEALERIADGDERLELATITGVVAEPDLRNATVYMSSMSPEAAEALAAHRASLQAALGRQLTFKRTPRLSFQVDPAVEQGAVVEELLRKIHTNALSTAAPSTAEPSHGDGGQGGGVTSDGGETAHGGGATAEGGATSDG